MVLTHVLDMLFLFSSLVSFKCCQRCGCEVTILIDLYPEPFDLFHTDKSQDLRQAVAGSADVPMITAQALS